YRKYDTPLAGWPLVHTFAMYVRKDIAAQLWDYGPETATTPLTPTEDPYMTRYRPLVADRSIGVLGELIDPKGIAVGADGRLYVADGRNNRILVYADG
ncbi:MAG: hypothetical protein QME94_00960, partial [Anaerolineae bacterium]|nr:hypothetical protein [Anaerolineae bacterium]